MYKPRIETASREVLQDLQFRLFRNQLGYVYEHSPMYRRKYGELGLEPGDIKRWDDIRKVPFTTKEDIRVAEAENPPFGNMLCVPAEEIVRVFQTSGTTGEPIRVAFTPGDWFGTACEQVAYAADGYDLKKSDVVFILFNYSTFLGWWAVHDGFQPLGATVIPSGGQSSKERIRNIIEWKVTFLCGTPTYILYLGEIAKEMKIELATQSQVRIVLASGEPGAAIPATRRMIEDTWGAKCIDGMGATEMGVTFGFECVHQKGMHILESMFLPEIIDPNTEQPVLPGETGELVMSNLCMKTMPLIRYKMRDLVRLAYDPCDCGRKFARMDGGILGRIDDMIFFNGVNIYPSSIENLVRSVSQFSPEFQIVVPQRSSGKRLGLRVEPASKSITDNELRSAIVELVDLVKLRIRITPEIEIRPISSLPRSEQKARRVIEE